MTPDNTHVQILYPPAIPWLQGRGGNVTSQFGEDGLIAATLERIGETTRHCFEVGANDGVWFSNTKALRDAGWSAWLIERDADAFAKLQARCGPNEHAMLADIILTPLDACLPKRTAQGEFDLGVIDIDGQDYWAWHDMQLHRPRVMLVEIVPNEPARKVERNSQIRCDQAGLNPIVKLGESKGYICLAHTLCNALFVRKELI